MSTKDQTLSAELHGEALLTARCPELQPLIDHLREGAQGRDDIRVEVAGTIAGSWFWPGLSIFDALDRWMRIGWQRRRGADIPYGPTS